MNSDTPTATAQRVFKFTGYDSICCLSVADMLLALGQLGVTCTKDTSKTKLTSALLQAVLGDFIPAFAKRQESQQEQLELQLQEFKADIFVVVADVKATMASLQANPVPQTSQLAELKDIREELQVLKDSQEGGWKTIVRNMSQQADAPQQQERVLNAVLRNFEEVEGETYAALLERVKAKLGDKLGINVELTATYRQPTKRGVATAKGEAQSDPAPNRLRPVVMTFTSAVTQTAVFKARKHLAGTKWGLDDDLTPLQQSQRKALQPQWLDAKRLRWKGDELFVDGHPVKPTT
ncbi:unnamed protein product [Sphagnum jensenii]|uniref:Uncharacterized protein n=1 Tax=Sphagnum jensenii TaxID=128206 RepID=A0ABP1AEJ5_9BRYO